METNALFACPSVEPAKLLHPVPHAIMALIYIMELVNQHAPRRHTPKLLQAAASLASPLA